MFRFTIAWQLEPYFFILWNGTFSNKKPCKRRCLQGFSSSPSWARTNNPAVNSRVLYHWAIEDYSVFLHIFFGVRPCRCSTDWAIEDYSLLPLLPSLLYLQNYTFTWTISWTQGQAFDLLVSVSSTHYCASTPDLSTSSSSRGLIDLLSGISYLEGGFTLRCLQRLSRPDLATRLCTWQYNRYTSGQSTPVLSY